MFFASYDDDFVNCIKADFCVRCIFGSNSLNGVQLVPQGCPRWIGLQLDYIERWVFPVFKPTYGLSKAMAADYCFSPLHLHFSFKQPPPKKKKFHQVGCPNSEGGFGLGLWKVKPMQISRGTHGSMQYISHDPSLYEPHLLTYGWKAYLYL